MEQTPKSITGASSYYRVCASGCGGAIKRSADEAWQSWERAVKREYGYYDSDMGTAQAAHSPAVAVGTTRRAVQDADISDAYGRRVGKGEWNWL